MPLIRLVTTNDIGAIFSLSLVAWVPVLHSFEAVLGPVIYHFLFSN